LSSGRGCEEAELCRESKNFQEASIHGRCQFSATFIAFRARCEPVGELLATVFNRSHKHDVPQGHRIPKRQDKSSAALRQANPRRNWAESGRSQSLRVVRPCVHRLRERSAKLPLLSNPRRSRRCVDEP